MSACAQDQVRPDEESFTLIVLPDTQHMINFERQKAQGFAIDSSELFLGQMEYIAGKSVKSGGDVVFVASVGDVWQHAVTSWDPAHTARNVVPEPDTVHRYVKSEATLNYEIPKAVEGYEILRAAAVPFGIAPGNHDYDAWWQVAGSTRGANGRFPAHIGGLDHFRNEFGSDSQFFDGKDWYVSAFRGGANSAQVFSAGGYQFLHLALEMQPGDEVLVWAEEVVAEYPGLPTIITTHDFLDAHGRRDYVAMELAAIDPEYHNTRQEMWEKFIRNTDQIFLVLCGHRSGQSIRIDDNAYGHKVYQVLSDYQQRGQAGLDAGHPREPNGDSFDIGDGWLREMQFHINGDAPRIEVRTYSSHYGVYSSELGTYAEWYKADEQPNMSDEEFAAADEFTIELSDFYSRFGTGNLE
ncbi:MAG: serine/threonine protein phosphatase [Woeseiaceae bacterium]